MERAEVLATLEGFPARLKSLLDGVPPEALTARPADGSWTVVDIVAHLLAADAIVAHRILALLAGPGARFEEIDERRWVEVTRLDRLPLETLLLLYGVSRLPLVLALRYAEPVAWDSAGTHAARGPVTVGQLAAELARHEAEHFEQLRALLPKVWPDVAEWFHGTGGEGSWTIR